MNSTTFAYRLCNADDFDVGKDLNLAFMQEEIQDEDLWNNPDKEDVDTWKKTFEEALQSEDMIRLVLFEMDGIPVGFANIMIIYRLNDYPFWPFRSLVHPNLLSCYFYLFQFIFC